MNESLKNKAAKGMFWAVGERVLTQGTLFVISIVLARLLTPTEYGVLSILLVFTNLADVLVTNGLGESLVRQQNVSKQDYSTVFICGLLLSLVLYVVLFFASPLISGFYGMESISTYLKVLALRIPFSSLNAIQKAYVAKNFLFKKQFSATFFASLGSGLVAIVLAYQGAGVYALIAQQLLTVILTSIILYIAVKWFPGFHFSRKSLFEVVPTGFQFCGASLVNALYSEGRSLLIGKVYSSADLAYFNRGNQFPSLIVSNLNTPISNVMLPVMAEVNDDGKKLKAITQKSMQLAAFVVFPLMAILALCGAPLVRLLLTEKWLPCVPYLQAACIFYLFQPLQTMNWQALKAAGEGGLCFKLELIKKIIAFVLLGVSIPFGVMAISVSSVISGFISMLVNMGPNKRILDYGIFEQGMDMLKPLFSTLVASLAAVALSMLPVNDYVLLALQVVIPVVVYLLVSKLVRSEGFVVLVGFLSAKKD